MSAKFEVERYLQGGKASQGSYYKACGEYQAVGESTIWSTQMIIDNIHLLKALSQDLRQSRGMAQI